jgi:hypothetical protein
VLGDYDNNDDINIINVNQNAPTYVLRDRTDGRNHWIMFRIVNRHGPTALGARPRLEVTGRIR